MKRTLFFLALCFTTSFVFAQYADQDTVKKMMAPANQLQTTVTEYNYIKKGIIESEDKGLDVKRGYELVSVGSANGLRYANATLIAKNLIRLKDRSIAGTYVKIIVSGTFSGNGVSVFCIPAPNYKYGESYGWNQFYNDVDAAGQTARSALLKWLAYHFSSESRH